jgi:hypothetical protein
VKSITATLVRSTAYFTFIVIGVACSSAEITLGGALSVTTSSNAPVSVSDSLVLEYDVTGQSLAGLQLAWGDGQVDSVGFLGAQTAGGRRAHLYDSAGSYTIRATAVDQYQGSMVSELPVVITP